MKLKDFKQAMDWRRRVGFNGGGYVKKKVLPQPKPKEEAEKVNKARKEKTFKGFESNNALKIWDGTYQNALENSSALIKTLMNSEESSFIIYPKVIKNEIRNQISLMRNNSWIYWFNENLYK